jgi:hypothetical protein
MPAIQPRRCSARIIIRADVDHQYLQMLTICSHNASELINHAVALAEAASLWRKRWIWKLPRALQANGTSWLLAIIATEGLVRSPEGTEERELRTVVCGSTHR